MVVSPTGGEHEADRVGIAARRIGARPRVGDRRARLDQVVTDRPERRPRGVDQHRLVHRGSGELPQLSERPVQRRPGSALRALRAVHGQFDARSIAGRHQPQFLLASQQVEVARQCADGVALDVDLAARRQRGIVGVASGERGIGTALLRKRRGRLQARAGRLQLRGAQTAVVQRRFDRHAEGCHSAVGDRNIVALGHAVLRLTDQLGKIGRPRRALERLRGGDVGGGPLHHGGAFQRQADTVVDRQRSGCRSQAERGGEREAGDSDRPHWAPTAVSQARPTAASSSSNAQNPTAPPGRATRFPRRSQRCAPRPHRSIRRAPQ